MSNPASSPKPALRRIDTFLDSLSLWRAAGDPVVEGPMFLANLLDCCEQKIASRAHVTAFLDDCASLSQQSPHLSPVEVISTVAVSMMDGDPPQPRYLRLSRQLGFGTAGARVSSVTTYNTFFRYHLGKNNGKVGPALLPAPLPSAPSALQKMQREIEQITTSRGWHLEEASLGQPLPSPSNCWISIDRFPDRRAQLPPQAGESPADLARDELGLVHHPAGTHLLRYTFDADGMEKIPGFDMARPTVADLGNSRFRVKHSCERSQDMAVAGWGCTVHLGRLPDRKLHPATGRPERVTTALPLRNLQQLSVEYLRATTRTRGKRRTDNDVSFLKTLLRGKKIPNVKKRILKFISTE